MGPETSVADQALVLILPNASALESKTIISLRDILRSPFTRQRLTSRAFKLGSEGFPLPFHIEISALRFRIGRIVGKQPGFYPSFWHIANRSPLLEPRNSAEMTVSPIGVSLEYS